MIRTSRTRPCTPFVSERCGETLNDVMSRTLIVFVLWQPVIGRTTPNDLERRWTGAEIKKERKGETMFFAESASGRVHHRCLYPPLSLIYENYWRSYLGSCHRRWLTAVFLKRHVSEDERRELWDQLYEQWIVEKESYANGNLMARLWEDCEREVRSLFLRDITGKRII